ncbi:Frataxin, mitochondrial [Hondaea fermentalgiana]|uniref:Frataxin, mitochondrial n=1 Tax=Hondaea fermentalgiana TaxID=2315210 RepID=A0A2R5GJM1_9STRA|nr:Frataxin, mitochondrial [Hondaea fermentalgiana]|eukprot:GBG28481.1 Frataxin, mitochondrial [Hondaea fermentalgiana]
MSENQFEQLVGELFHELESTFDELAMQAEDATGELCEATAMQDVVEVNLGNLGVWVMNKQTPNRQVWLSSPVSGPKRYRYEASNQTWVNTRDGHELSPFVVKEMEDALAGIQS